VLDAVAKVRSNLTRWGVEVPVGGWWCVVCGGWWLVVGGAWCVVVGCWWLVVRGWWLVTMVTMVVM